MAPPTTITLGTTIGQTGTTARPQAVLPAGTIQLKPTFQPLNVPKDISQVKLAPTPAPKAPVPAEAPRSASPASVVVVPEPSVAPKKAAPALAPVPQAAPAPSPIPQAAPAPPATPKPNKFFVFQPFNQKPASKPFRTPVNPDAFVIKPQAAPARPPQSPPTLISQGGRPVPVPQGARPVATPQAVPAPPRPAPAAPQRPAAPRAPSSPIPQSQLPPGVFAVPAGQPIPAGAIRVNPQGQAINSQGQV